MCKKLDFKNKVLKINDLLQALTLQSLLKLFLDSIYPILIISLRIITSFLLIFVVSKNTNSDYKLFSVDYSFIGIFLVFGNFYIQKSSRSKGGKSNLFWLIIMIIITSTFLIINNYQYCIFPISLNLISQYFLSLDYCDNNKRYQKSNVVLLILQFIFLLASFIWWINYKVLLGIYLSLPLLVTFRFDLLNRLSFEINNLKFDLHMIFWMLVQSFCFPVAFYFFRVYLGSRDFSLIEFDLIQKFLLIPSLMFGTILSSRLYVQDLSKDIFNLSYKPFRIFFGLTLFYFIMGISLLFYLNIYFPGFLKTFSLYIIILFSVIELLKFVYGHLANFFYFFASSIILVVIEVIIASSWYFSVHLDFELYIVLFNVIIIYLFSILLVNRARKSKLYLINLK